MRYFIVLHKLTGIINSQANLGIWKMSRAGAIDHYLVFRCHVCEYQFEAYQCNFGRTWRVVMILQFIISILSILPVRLLF